MNPFPFRVKDHITHGMLSDYRTIAFIKIFNCSQPAKLLLHRNKIMKRVNKFFDAVNMRFKVAGNKILSWCYNTIAISKHKYYF
jgi:hypothetical protein